MNFAYLPNNNINLIQRTFKLPKNIKLNLKRYLNPKKEIKESKIIRRRI